MKRKLNPYLEGYLKVEGQKHTDLNEFWAKALNDTKGKIVNELHKAGYKTLNELRPYLRRKR